MSRATSSRPSSWLPDFAAPRGDAPSGRRPFLGGAVPSWFRKPYGDGWALVGDAGYNKDPITAQGITDAFLDAERCSRRGPPVARRGPPFDEVMGAWHQERDAKDMPIYEFTAQLATLELPPPEMQQLLGAVHGNQQAMDAFVSVVSGAVSPADYFSEENVGSIFAAVRGRCRHRRWQAATDEPFRRDSRSRSGLDGWEGRLRAARRGPTCRVHEQPRGLGVLAVRRAAGWSESGRIRILLIAEAGREADVRHHLLDDPWETSRQLVITSIEPWNLLVGAARLLPTPAK